MTGPLTPQPFLSDDRSIAVVFNGEIYNYKELCPTCLSDGECLVGLYTTYGAPMFARLLDGEFAIVIHDFARQVAVLASDPFGTKPLSYACDSRGVHAATYESSLIGLGLEARHVPPNTVLEISLDGGCRETPLGPTFEFDLRQFKTDTSDWQRAFTAAVEKRVRYARPGAVFLGLSSGYDSGAIQSALVGMSRPHSAYSIYSQEDLGILEARAEYSRNVSDSTLFILTEGGLALSHTILQERGEPFHYSQRGRLGMMFDDPAASGMAFICGVAREEGRTLYLSGTGADETISDYGFNGTRIFPHSDFGGLFPTDLEGLFPWQSFFLGTQRDYLMKEEMVAGAFGIEARYPFLDRRVVQEYLWLTADVKNSEYKKPVADFLEGSLYPVLEGKRGFDAHVNILPGVDLSQRVVLGTTQGGGMPPTARQDDLWRLEAELDRARLFAESLQSSFLHMQTWWYVRLQQTLRRPWPATHLPNEGIVKAITCVTDQNDTVADLPVFKILQATSPVTVVNTCADLRSSDWSGMNVRVKSYADYLSREPPDDALYIVVDGMDVFFNDLSRLSDTRGLAVDQFIKEVFETFGKPIVLSTERLCGWGGANECSDEEIARFPEASTDSRFLNAGAYMGGRDALLSMLLWVIEFAGTADFKSDQRLFFEFYWSHPHLVALDHQQLLFGNFIETVGVPCPDGWKPPCAHQPCCTISDDFGLFNETLGLYEIRGCEVARRADSGDHRLPIAWHGNGVGKWMFLLIVDELARQCPPVAEAILSSTSADNILSGFAAIAHHQERSESYRAATASRVGGLCILSLTTAMDLTCQFSQMKTLSSLDIFRPEISFVDAASCVSTLQCGPWESQPCQIQWSLVTCTRVTAVHCRLLCRALEIAGVRIDTIDLSYNPIQDEGCTAIASLVQGGANKIKLRGCMLSGTGVSRLLSALRSSSCDTEELDFSDNPIGTAAGVEIADWLRRTAEEGAVLKSNEGDGGGNTGLKSLLVDSCDLGYDAVHAIINVLDPNNAERRAAVVEGLDISNPRLQNHQNSQLLFEHMGRMLSSNTRLRKLHLGKMRMKDDTLKILIDALASNLDNEIAVLDLRCNLIGWKGLQVLAAYIQSDSCKLTHLNLEANRIGDMLETAAVVQFCHAVAQPGGGIVALNVNRNSLCGNALLALVKCVRECAPRLGTVMWYFNDWDEEAKESLKAIPHLEYLSTDIFIQEVCDENQTASHAVYNGNIAWNYGV
ncbi:hypothetical protein FOL46_006936 [Perkinsus olseni]|uniref:Glutamine amidotransferase type-2 domain-containing protein n=1 Tax=Perkinsus olseni TaxID=32597 RepID=A0A7J6LGX0_PEROL|nr:hypothetical protein FOL46_006936 [Perkinsus olseni]